MRIFIYSFIGFAFFQISACKKTNNSTIDRVIIIVIDGVRNSDINSDSLLYYNKGYQELKTKGISFTNYLNAGTTNTQNGMSNILTGHQETLTNNGAEMSDFPNIFHFYLAKFNLSNDKTWIITSKDKLETLKNTTDVTYSSALFAKTSCGINGLGTGYREDSITYQIALSTLKTSQPNLAFITFKEPDYSGHSGNWENYKKGLKNSITYTQNLINYIQSDAYYQGRTLILVTNDHGRHLDGVADGFISHGDDCYGCRHITLLAISPNITPNTSDMTLYSHDNIAPTIARILGFPMTSAKANSISSIY